MNDREWLMNRRFAGMSLGLERVEALLERLGNPQLDFPSIHVAGTNGKGTLCAFLSSAAANSGLKVGLFTTPHLVMVEERVRVDGAVIAPSVFDENLATVREAAVAVGEELGEEPTFYECTFAIAMLTFSREGVDRAIIETGLGGAGDATCLVDADLCAITTIGLDHTEILGNTRVEIARAKAGIHRPGVPLVMLHPGNSEVLSAIGGIAGDDFYIHEGIEGDTDPWHIWYFFAASIATAMGWEMPSLDINWPGRSPNWTPPGFSSSSTFSAAHNDEGLRVTLDSITEPVVLLVGMSQKADLEQATSYLVSEMQHTNIFRHIVITQPATGRLPAADTTELAELLSSPRFDPPLIEPDPIQAIEIANLMAQQAGIGLAVMGSIYLIGDILKVSVAQSGEDIFEQLRVH